MVGGLCGDWLNGGFLDGSWEGLVIVGCFKVCFLKNRAIDKQNGTDRITHTDTLNA